MHPAAAVHYIAAVAAPAVESLKLTGGEFVPVGYADCEPIEFMDGDGPLCLEIWVMMELHSDSG